MQKPASAPEGAPTSPRCRPGDLAVIIAGDYIGLMVTVLHAERPIFAYAGPCAKYNGVPHWMVESGHPIKCDAFQEDVSLAHIVTLSTAESSRFLCPDPMLRPIRDGAGADETFSWTLAPCEMGLV